MNLGHIFKTFNIDQHTKENTHTCIHTCTQTYAHTHACIRSKHFYI